MSWKNLPYWLKGGIIGFFIWVMVFLVSYSFFANHAHEKKIYFYTTFSDCRECKNSGKTNYICAFEVVEKEPSKWKSVSELKSSSEQYISSRISSLKEKCINDLTKIKSDIYLFGNSEIGIPCDKYHQLSSEYSVVNQTEHKETLYGQEQLKKYEVDLSNAEKSCENSIKEACENPEKIGRLDGEQVFYNQICDNRNFFGAIFDGNQEKMNEGKKPTLIETFFNKKTYHGYMDMVFEGFPMFGLFGVLALFVILGLPLWGVLIGLIVGKIKSK